MMIGEPALDLALVTPGESDPLVTRITERAHPSSAFD